MKDCKSNPKIRPCRTLFSGFLDIQGIRFILAGVTNSIVGFCTFSLIVLLGGASWVAILSAQATGIIINYLTYGSFVFRNLSISRFPKFVLAYVVLFMINLGSLNILLNLLSISQLLIQALLTMPLAGLSYAIMNKIVFR